MSLYEADHRDRCSGRAKKDLHALLDAVGLEYVVGVNLAGGRWIGHSDRRQLVAEQGGRSQVARSVAGDPPAQLHDTDPTGCRRPRPPTRSSPEGHHRYGCAKTTIGGRGEDEEFAVLRLDSVRGGADQPVEQTSEEHHEHADEREDHGRRDEATRSPPELAQRQLHRSPATAVAEDGSIANTRQPRAAS